MIERPAQQDSAVELAVTWLADDLSPLHSRLTRLLRRSQLPALRGNEGSSKFAPPDLSQGELITATASKFLAIEVFVGAPTGKALYRGTISNLDGAHVGQAESDQ